MLGYAVGVLVIIVLVIIDFILEDYKGNSILLVRVLANFNLHYSWFYYLGYVDYSMIVPLCMYSILCCTTTVM